MIVLKNVFFVTGKKKVVDLLSRLGDDAQSKSVDTTNPPAVVQTTKYPIVIETTESSVFIQTTQPAVDTLTTNAPTVAASTPTEAVRNGKFTKMKEMTHPLTLQSKLLLQFNPIFFKLQLANHTHASLRACQPPLYAFWADRPLGVENFHGWYALSNNSA